MTERWRLVVVGCSAGALGAMHGILDRLSAPLPIPMALVCHSASDDMAGFCALLERSSGLRVVEAEERQLPEPGCVHVAPVGYHLLLERSGRFALSVDERVDFSRPSINVLFESAADSLGAGVIGVVLTGANGDGAAGLRRVRQRGGLAIVQDPATAEVATMPAAALELAGADHVVPLQAIAPLLEQLCLD